MQCCISSLTHDQIKLFSLLWEIFVWHVQCHQHNMVLLHAYGKMKFWGVCWLTSKTCPREQLKDSVGAASELNFFNLLVDYLVSTTLLGVSCYLACCTAHLNLLLPGLLINPHDLGESCWASCQLPTAAAWEALAADLCVAKQWRSDSAFLRRAGEREQRCSQAPLRKCICQTARAWGCCKKELSQAKESVFPIPLANTV